MSKSSCQIPPAVAAAARLVLLFGTLVVVPVGGAANTTADARQAVLGLWASKGTIFSITEADGQLLAEVIAMRKPRLDQKNPREALRTRPVVGLQVLSGYEFRRNAWRGRIYDPASGHTFKSHMKRDADGNLRVRGYVGISLFGKTEIFRPVSDCTERIVGMLDSVDLGHLC